MKPYTWLALKVALSTGLLFATGCDDSAPSGTKDTGVDGGGCIENCGPGGMGGGIGGMGGGAGMSPMTECFDDEGCINADQYCNVPPGEVLGACTDGCRADGCAAGLICDIETRECVCGSDEACADDEYCNEAGACVDGCRVGGDRCDMLTEAGRTQVCDEETHDCVELFVCCSGANSDTCSLDAQAKCEASGGRALTSALTCDREPCAAIGTPCTEETEAADCPEGRYCDSVDGICLDGCRIGECPDPDQVCDPIKRSCEDLRCDDDADCPEDRFCDVDGGSICRVGCRDDDGCPDGQCINGACVGEMCDPDSPDACGINQYCDPGLNACRDECGEHEDCDFANEFCSPINHCEDGCRDDLGDPGLNDDQEHATPIELAAEGASLVGEAEGTYCSGNPDFYAIEVNAGVRVRVELTFEQPDELQGLNVRMHSVEIEGGSVESATLEVPEIIEYPPINEFRQATTYYLEVFSNIDSRVDYNIRVVVIDSVIGCFPDIYEAGDGNNNKDNATRIQQDRSEWAGTICDGDEDWWVMPMGINDGLEIEAIGSPESDGIEIRLYDAARLDLGGGGLGNPNEVIEMGMMIPAGTAYRFSADQGMAAFSDSDWYVRLRGVDDAAIANYTLNIIRTPDDQECGDDGGTEPNDDLATGVDLNDAAYALNDANNLFREDEDLLVPLDLEICPRDEDIFCFDAIEFDDIDAWVVSDGVAGELSVTILDEQAGAVGSQARHTAPGEDPDKAQVRGAAPGRYCIRVDGLDAAQGPYELYVARRNNPPDGMCGNDLAEVGGRNDSSEDATELPEIVEERRFEFQTGLICDIAPNQDEDWYTFEVTEENSRICAMINGFQDSRADLDLALFRDVPPGDSCQRDAECNLGGQGDAECIRGICAEPCQNNADCQANSACINNRCTPAEGDSRTQFDMELISISKNIVGDRVGTRYVRVNRGANGDQESYRLQVTVTPVDEICPADFQERNNPNDNIQAATPLGSGQVGICDTWICQDDEGGLARGDWYSVIVPPEEDRTVIVNYLTSDGRIYLNYQGPQPDPDDQFSGLRRAHEQVGAQCINIRGGEIEHEVNLQVALRLINADDPDGRVDYSIRVVPTDLDVDPQGECLTFGAPNLGACIDALDEGCWPIAELP